MHLSQRMLVGNTTIGLHFSSSDLELTTRILSVITSALKDEFPDSREDFYLTYPEDPYSGQYAFSEPLEITGSFSEEDKKEIEAIVRRMIEGYAEILYPGSSEKSKCCTNTLYPEDKLPVRPETEEYTISKRVREAFGLQRPPISKTPEKSKCCSDSDCFSECT